MRGQSEWQLGCQVMSLPTAVELGRAIDDVMETVVVVVRWYNR